MSDQDKTVSYSPTFPSFFTKLSYSNVLGIMKTPSFSLRNYKEDNLVLIYTARGCLFCEQSGESFSCGEGEYLLLDKRVVHSYYFDPSIPSEILWMHINGSVALEIAARINSFSKLPFIDSNPQIPKILRDCLDMHEQEGADAFESSMLINRALCVILNDAYERNQKREYSNEEYAFRTEIDKILYASDFSTITLDSLCRRMKMNKYYFSHTFKRYYGVPPMRYVNTLKLEKAKYLLRSSDIKISAVAQKYGFSSHTHFSSAFRKEFGMSPEEYRNDSKGDNNDDAKR